MPSSLAGPKPTKMLSDNELFRKLRGQFTTPTTIWGFRDEYEFLSHFYPSPVVAYRRKFPTVEHAYQFSMVIEPEWKEKIAAAKSPRQVKFYRHMATDRPDVASDINIKLNIMYILDSRKFVNNPELLSRLKSTGNRILIEGNTWHDNFWGDCQCYKCKDIKGLNWSGKILMLVRNKLC
jgi:ribA/ribD-fused uncharacterized protein